MLTAYCKDRWWWKKQRRASFGDGSIGPRDACVPFGKKVSMSSLTHVTVTRHHRFHLKGNYGQSERMVPTRQMAGWTGPSVLDGASVPSLSGAPLWSGASTSQHSLPRGPEGGRERCASDSTEPRQLVHRHGGCSLGGFRWSPWTPSALSSEIHLLTFLCHLSQWSCQPQIPTLNNTKGRDFLWPGGALTDRIPACPVLALPACVSSP